MASILLSLTSLLLSMTPAVSAPRQVNRNDPDSLSMLQEMKAQTQAQSRAFSYLRQLSDDIGPRLTGSASATVACQWAVERMQFAGLHNVHLEPWTLSRSWDRGHAIAQLVLPFKLGLDAVSYGWTGSTRMGGIQADVTVVNSDLIPDEVKQHAKLWTNKVLFITPMGPKHVNPIRSYSQIDALLTAATKAGAIAVIYPTGRPGVMLPHTGPAVFHDAYYSIPVLDIPNEQDRLLQRLLFSRKRVRIKLDVQNTVSKGPVQSANVVGDLPGYEHPEQVVVVGAHLDSWDLATGSIDDGFGVAAVLGAADAILFQHVPQRRTIRFVLFTGEEGLLGSLAYVKQHRAEIPNTVCALVLDWGSGPITKFPLAGHADLEADFSHFALAVNDLGTIQVDSTYLSFTDAYAFTLAGIPGIAPLQDSPNYVSIGHSAADTFDKVDNKTLLIDTALLACTAFWVANYPTRLGDPWSVQKTENALAHDNQRTLLDLFGLWKYVEKR